MNEPTAQDLSWLDGQAVAPETRTVTDWQPWISGWIIAASLIGVLSYLFVTASPFQIDRIDGTQRVLEARYCDLAGDVCDGPDGPVTLPHFSKRFNQADIVYGRYQFDFDIATGEDLQALYIPQVMDSVRVSVNGTLIADSISRSLLKKRQTFAPKLYPLPDTLLQSGSNRLQIDVMNYGQEGLRLYPIYVGPNYRLNAAYDLRYWVTRGAARLGFFMLGIVSIGMGLLAFAWRQDQSFLWLFLAGVCATVMAGYFAFDTVLFSYRSSVIQFIFSLQVFIYCAIRFFFSFLNIRVRWITWSYTAYLILSLTLHLFSPDSHIMTVAVWLTVGNFVWTFFGMAMLWAHRHLFSPSVFWAFYLTFVGASICAAHDWQYFMPNTPVSDMPLLQFLPLFAAISVLLLVGSQMMSALRRSENFTLILQDQIAETKAELARSYELLAQNQKRQAIDQERNRIMLDLHDGVGGQLVNILAYMQNRQIQDDTLKDALDDALTDLGLMIDSLQYQDSATTLIAMFRARAEPLLSRHGLRFQWEIGDEPIMPKTGPSENLTLLRIVQEAVTNAVKHSGANVIRVHTDSRSVTIADNGKGFDKLRVRDSSEGGGVGLLSMRHRAKKLGANLNLKSDKTGTTVKIIWPETGD